MVKKTEVPKVTGKSKAKPLKVKKTTLKDIEVKDSRKLKGGRDPLSLCHGGTCH